MRGSTGDWEIEITFVVIAGINWPAVNLIGYSYCLMYMKISAPPGGRAV